MQLRRRVLKTAWVIALSSGVALLSGSCGSRSGLLEGGARAEVDSGQPVDASADRSVVDAAQDREVPDVMDAKPGPKDVQFDGLAPCDPNALFVYLVTSSSDFYRYDPQNGSVTKVGVLDCPTNGNPFSMGVSRTGTAYILHRPLAAPGANAPGQLFAANVDNAVCVATGFVPKQNGFGLFGMGFALDDDGMGETLYVAAGNQPANTTQGLGTIDLASMQLDVVGPFTQAPGDRFELTSSDDGSLYGYVVTTGAQGGFLVRIDKATAAIVVSTPLNVQGNANAFAFAYWGGDFYIFTAPSGGPTTFTRYQPDTGSLAVVGSLPQAVVGAGVSTCSPSERN